MKGNIEKALKLKELKALKQFKDVIQGELGQKLIKLILFGSKARSKGEKYSDIDVLVLVKKEERDIKDKIYDIAFDIFFDSDIDISPTVMSEEYFNWLKSIERRIALDIEKEGIPIE